MDWLIVEEDLVEEVCSGLVDWVLEWVDGLAVEEVLSGLVD